MNLADHTGPGPVDTGAESMLAELAREERVRSALGTLLPQLVSGDDTPALGEELVIRTRALLAALAGDLLRHLGDQAGLLLAEPLAQALAARPAVLGHCHALALEAVTAERLGAATVDPVLSPLLETILAGEGETAALAMSVLAAQARFVCRQRRLETVAAELPAEAMHEALVALADCPEVAGGGAQGAQAAAALRAEFDEGRSRLALLGRLARAGSGPDDRLLDPAAAGFALFATALAQRAGVPREEVILASAGGQDLRLALLLRTAGASVEATRAALGVVHPAARPPGQWLDLPGSRAAALLAGALA